MQRDHDLFRELLLAMEKGTGSRNPEVPGYTNEQVGYHAWLMSQQGLIKAVDVTSMSDNHKFAIVTAILPAGHDYLDAVRDDSVWGKLKAKVGAKLPQLSFEAIKFAASEIGKQQLQQLLG